MQWLPRTVATHPVAVFLTATFSAAAFIIIAVITTDLPDFTEPQLGFESRGTGLAKRAAAWDNLLKATRPSGQLVANPKEWEPPLEEHFFDNQTILAAPEEPRRNLSDTFCEDEWRCLEKTNELAELEEHEHMHLTPDGFFCTDLSPAYGHVVFASREENEDRDLFNAHSIKSMCQIEETLLRGSPGFDSLCQTVHPDGPCCPSWSIGNYIALMHNRTSCHHVTDDDVNATLGLLSYCAPFYHTLRLGPDCDSGAEMPACRNVPASCTRHNAVYYILHYLTDFRFLPPEEDNAKVTYASVFLPIAKSIAALQWYQQVELHSLTDGVTEIIAMDLGLKSALFSNCLLRDTFLVLCSGVAIFACMWAYTASLIVTVATLVSIASSLGVSYFLYTVVFQIHFFPFMNLLAAVVSIGVGCDGTFVYCKAWECAKAEKNSGTLSKIVSDAFRHAGPSIFVTSMTTAAAFYASYIGRVTAIRCFGIFAGTAILANFALTLTLIPAAVVISEQWCHMPCTQLASIYASTVALGHSAFGMLASVIFRLRFVWIALFGMAAIFGGLATFYSPRLQLPDSGGFQLFRSSHPFEVYDMHLKDMFRFERAQHDDDAVEKLPLRFVWGVVAVDNGDHLNPTSRGSLMLDSTFNVSSPESQTWLLQFCHELQAQSFYGPTLGPMLPNCFIQTFKSWMERRCSDTIEDRTPCCETSLFPFNALVFEQCIGDAVRSLYETPAEFFIPGIAGPKFDSAGHIRVAVVEYDSNITYTHSYLDMQHFYSSVERWAHNQMASAPSGMQNGWFISHLAFYDLQRCLASDTAAAMLVALGVSLLVVLLTTLNLLVSLYAVAVASSTILVSIGTLVALGWKLNIVESVAVTAAIGLAADYPLHYAMCYKIMEGDRPRRAMCTVTKMGAPVTMAALTTMLAGLFMLPSTVLAYKQIGTFIVVLTLTSWSFSTFLLTSLLAAAGPEGSFGQLQLPACQSGSPTQAVDKAVYSVVLSESNLSTSSATCPALSHSESHELEPLTTQNRSARCSRPRSVSLTNQKSGSLTPGRKVSLPTPALDVGATSSVGETVGSDTTIIMSDELDSLEASQQVLVM